MLEVNYKKVLLQVPEGLKTKVLRIAEDLERKGIDVVIDVDPCFGACDIPVDVAKQVGAEAIIHVGHNEFYRKLTDFPVIYVPIDIDVDFPAELSEKLPRRIGLVTTIQHINSLEKIKKAIESTGRKVVIGGQILGCWTENARKIEDDVDCFLYIGSGLFHPLAIRTEKRVFIYDVEKSELREITALIKKEQAKRYARIEKAKDCNSVGILVSTKLGQFNIKTAQIVKRVAEQHGKKAFIFISDIIKKDRVMGLGVDCFVNTACPRIVDDDFGAPVVNADEFLIAMGDSDEGLEK